MSEDTPASPSRRRSRRDRKAADSARPEQDETPVSLGYVDSLQYCLDRRGTHVEKVTLMGLSGETFRTFYDPNVPERGPYVVAFNPLRAACSALGYDCEIAAAPAMDEALKAVRDAVREGGALIIHGAGEWVVVLAADGRPEHVRVRFPSGAEATWSAKQLAEAWLCEPGLLELGLSGHYYFTLGDKTREPNPKEAALGALRRGIRMLTRKTRVEGCVPGTNVYLELLGVLTRKRKDDVQKALDLSRYAAWSAFPLAYLRGTRVGAAAYLDSIRPHFEEKEAREHLEKAAAKFREAAKLLEALPSPPEHIPHVAVTERGPAAELTPENRQAVKDYMRLRRRAARQMRRLHKAEQDAVDELHKVIETVEREKRA